METLRPILADLHVHTVLSACAEVEMIPPLIVRQARRLGLGLIAVTDHNACGNAAAVIAAAAGTGLVVLPGMELQTREEVHLLCLFGELEPALAWQEAVWRTLPPLANNEEFFGAQFEVDREGRHTATVERLLQVSSEMGLEEAIAGVHALGGLAIPAHIDRPSFSLLANLGLVPPGLAADALEVTARWSAERGARSAEKEITPESAESEAWRGKNGISPHSALAAPHWYAGLPVIVSGDAHRLGELRNRTLFKISCSTLEELKLALRGAAGRKILVTLGD